MLYSGQWAGYVTIRILNGNNYYTGGNCTDWVNIFVLQHHCFPKLVREDNSGT